MKMKKTRTKKTTSVEAQMDTLKAVVVLMSKLDKASQRAITNYLTDRFFNNSLALALSSAMSEDKAREEFEKALPEKE